MTKILIQLAVCVLLLDSRSAIAQGTGQHSSCDALDHVQQMACVGNEITDRKVKLDALYRGALGKLAENDPNDSRRSRSQLEKAETAWSNYVNENCAYVGGQEGGSNSWVTYFGALCLVAEYDKRIEFFRNPLPMQ